MLFVISISTRSESLGQQTMHCPFCHHETPHNVIQYRQDLRILCFRVCQVGTPTVRYFCDECGGDEYCKPEDIVVEPGAATTRQCSNCGEYIRSEAFMCRFCGTQFSAEEIREVRRQAQAVARDTDTDSLHKRMQR